MRIDIEFIRALSLAPLSGSEFNVLFAVLYHMLPGERAAPLTARYLADFTLKSKRSIQSCIGDLVKQKVLISEKLSIQNDMAYGPNTCLTEWGNGSDEWKEFFTLIRRYIIEKK